MPRSPSRPVWAALAVTCAAFSVLLLTASSKRGSSPLVGELFATTFFGVLAFALAAKPGTDVRKELRLVPSQLDLFSRAVSVVGYLVILGGVSRAFPLLEPQEIAQPIRQLGAFSFPLAFLNVAILPAIAEELLCRGYIQGRLEHHVGPSWAIVGSAAVFAGMHLRPDIALIMFFAGLYLGFVVKNSGSVYDSMLIHFAGNALAFLSAA